MLRVHLGVTIHLGGGGQQEAGLHSLGQAKHVEGADGVGLDGLNGIVHVLDGGGWRGQVVDLVHLQHQRVDDVVVEQLKVVVPHPVVACNHTTLG